MITNSKPHLLYEVYQNECSAPNIVDRTFRIATFLIKSDAESYIKSQKYEPQYTYSLVINKNF